MISSIFGVINEKQRDDAAEFTKRDRRFNARAGFFNGGPVPFGYEARTVQVDGRKERRRLFVSEFEVPVVRLIYRLADEGNGNGPLGARAIADHLNTHGYSLRGARFHNSNVAGILSRDHYLGCYFDRTAVPAGDSSDDGEPIRVPCPALIDPEQAARVAAHRHHRRPSVTPPRVVNGPTLLVGRAFCGHAGCGDGLTIRTGKGGQYSYYTCARRANIAAARCTTKAMRREALDMAVLSTLSTRVLQPEHLSMLLARVLDLSANADRQRRADLTQARAEQARVPPVWSVCSNWSRTASRTPATRSSPTA